MRLNGRWQKGESMGEKDITEKLLMDYNDVFADIVNVLLFDGEEVIKEDSLSDMNARSQYKADTGEMHEQERDISKKLVDGNTVISLIGFENQTKPEKFMPARVFNYDGQSYRTQLLEKGVERLYPAITLVLYFGDTRWTEPRKMSECLDIPNKLKPYVSDYEIKNLFEVSYLSPEKVKLFKSDFGIVADYFVQMRTNREYTPSQEMIDHVDAFMKLMRVLTGDRTYEMSIPAQEKENGGVTMVSFLDKVEKKGEIKVYMNEFDYTPKEISLKIGMPESDVDDIMKAIKAEKNTEKINK